MIQARLLNSDATLNDYFQLDSLEFIPGENLTVVVQIQDSQRNIRYVPPSAAVLTMSFIDSSGDDFDKTAALVSADDRSMWKVVLSQAETETLAGQNIILSLDVNGDASVILKAVLLNVVIRTNLSGDC